MRVPSPTFPCYLISRLVISILAMSLVANFAFLPNAQTRLMTSDQQSSSISFANPPLVVEKPFQAKWSNSLGIRRKMSRPTGMGQPRSVEKGQQHGSLQQQLKKPLSVPIGTHQNDWTNQGQGEHKIVHLTSRPTQLYYFQEDHELNGDTIELGTGQVCRVKVPSSEVFYIAYEDGAGNLPSVDLFFHCSQYWAWCCDVDCCQIDPIFLLGGLCILILILCLLVHFCLRTKFGQRICLKLFRRRKRVIARANAQRRKRSGSSSHTGETRRTRTNSLKEGTGGHKKLAKASTSKDCGMVTIRRATKDIPEIVITEPSSCYEPSYKSASELGEDEEEIYDEED